MRVPPHALLVVIRSCPRTREQRQERHLIDHVPQRLVAGKAELDDPLLLAAPLGDGHGAGVRLQMPERLPAPGGVPQAGPERRRGDAMLTDRECPRPLRRRQTREKIVDGLPVLGDGRHDGHQLLHQGQHQARQQESARVAALETQLAALQALVAARLGQTVAQDGPGKPSR